MVENEKKRESNLKERLENFYQKPLEEIFVESSEEIDTRKPVGNEIWQTKKEAIYRGTAHR